MIFVALSSNLPSRYGEPTQTFAKVIDVLAKNNVRCVNVSDLWLTSPVPVSDQPWYHNGVMQVETELDAEELLTLFKTIEQDFGTKKKFQNDMRILDLDLLAYNDEIIEKEHLIVPHPRMHLRAFVLEPLNIG